jgi:hypothetical protein
VTEAVRGLRPLVSDVRTFGLLSATSVVDRYVDLVERTLGPGSAAAGHADRPGSPPDAPDLRLLARSTARMAEAYVGLLGAVAGVVGEAGPADGSAPRGVGAAFPATVPGGRAETTLWLHNPTSTPVPEVTLAATPLVAGVGAAVPLRLDPPRLEVLPARASVPVRLTTVVPAGQPPGTYHAVVVASADPDGPVTVTLRVVPAEGRP